MHNIYVPYQLVIKYFIEKYGKSFIAIGVYNIFCVTFKIYIKRRKLKLYFHDNIIFYVHKKKYIIIINIIKSNVCQNNILHV